MHRPLPADHSQSPGNMLQGKFGEPKMIPDDDWRRQGQERFLKGVTLVHKKYRLYDKSPRWDHDHCEFCGTKFSLLDNPEHSKEGYATEDDYHWICADCFLDFRDEFDWTVKEELE